MTSTTARTRSCTPSNKFRPVSESDPCPTTKNEEARVNLAGGL